eukprot:scaffold13360_cov95-Cyclotella_meneghiniana.AAC.1
MAGVMEGVGCGGYGCFCRLLELLWDLDCSAGVLLVVSRLASYRVLMSPCRNLLSRCEMSFRVVTLSGSGFGASMSCSNNMTSSQMGVGS